MKHHEAPRKDPVVDFLAAFSEHFKRKVNKCGTITFVYCNDCVVLCRKGSQEERTEKGMIDGLFV